MDLAWVITLWLMDGIEREPYLKKYEFKNGYQFICTNISYTESVLSVHVGTKDKSDDSLFITFPLKNIKVVMEKRID